MPFPEYTLKFSESDLRRDVAEKLEKMLKAEFPVPGYNNIHFNLIDDCIDTAINKIEKEGNNALYSALVQYGAQMALGYIKNPDLAIDTKSKS